MDSLDASAFWKNRFQDANEVTLQKFIEDAAPTIQIQPYQYLVEYVLDFTCQSKVTLMDFIGATKLFGPPNVFMKNLSAVLNMPAFMGRISATESHRLFESEGSNSTDGSYIVRMMPDWSGFEIDFVEKGVTKTTSVQATPQGLTCGGPCFETLQRLIEYYSTIYKRQYNRSFPRLSAFRWNLGIKETHALLKTSKVNEYILRLSNTNINSLSMGYRQADGKPCQILITLGPGSTYSVGNNTFTDFPSLLAAPAFRNLIPMPSTTRSLGAIAVPMKPYYESEYTPKLTEVKRGASLSQLNTPTTDPELYLMTSNSPTGSTSSEKFQAFPVTQSEKWRHRPSDASAFPQSKTRGPILGSRETLPTDTSSPNTSAFPPKPDTNINRLNDSNNAPKVPIQLDAYAEEDDSPFSQPARPSGLAVPATLSNTSLHVVEKVKTNSTKTLPTTAPPAKVNNTVLSDYKSNHQVALDSYLDDVSDRPAVPITLSRPPLPSKQNHTNPGSLASLSPLDRMPASHPRADSTPTPVNSNHAAKMLAAAQSYSGDLDTPLPMIPQSQSTSSAVNHYNGLPDVSPLENQIIQHLKCMDLLSVKALGSLTSHNPSVQSFLALAASFAKQHASERAKNPEPP